MGLPDVCNATTNQQYYTRRSFLLPIQRSVKQKNRKRIRAIIISISAGGFFPRMLYASIYTFVSFKGLRYTSRDN